MPAAATSSTQTGWNRVSAPASGINGNIRCSWANTFKNLSCAPKITLGRSTLRSSVPAVAAAFRTASPRALLRWYIDGPSWAAPSALTCTSRRTPVAAQALTIVRGNSTWTRPKVAAVPCRMATRFTTASMPVSRRTSVASSCTSRGTIVIPGRPDRWRACPGLREGTVTGQPACDSRTQMRRPTKPVPPRIRMRFMLSM